MTGSAADPSIGATQAVLDAEYAAAYGYGVVAAHTRGAARAQAARALAWHQAQQPVLAAILRTAGATVAAPQAAYVLPFAVGGPIGAGRLARRLEESVAAAYADLVAAASSTDRRTAALGLAACAVRAAQWRGSSVAFPGLPERSGEA